MFFFSDFRCNCLGWQADWRVDKGTYTDKDLLPLKGYLFMYHHRYRKAKADLGPLRCLETTFGERPCNIHLNNENWELSWCQLCRPLHWRHNDHDGVSNHQPHGCLLNRLFRRRSKKTLKLRVTGLCAGNSPETGEFPAQMASNAENVSIWWRHHVISISTMKTCYDIQIQIPDSLFFIGKPNMTTV